MPKVVGTSMKISEYLNKTVWATLASSKIHGIGVFAIRDIPEDTNFTDYNVFTGNQVVYCVLEDEFEEILPEIRNLILDRTILQNSIIFVSPNSVQDLRSFMNHSNDPNIIDWKTNRAIKKDEELTEDFCAFKGWHKLTKEHYDFINV